MAKRKKKNENEGFVETEASGIGSNEEISVSAHPYLADEVAAEFDLDWTGGHTVMAGKYGRINFSKLTLDQARKLVNNGFKRLILKY